MATLAAPLTRPRGDQWRVLIDEGRDAVGQMAADERLAAAGRLAVRFFTWRPAISLGYRQPLPAWCDPFAWNAGGLEWVRRPTGGGLAFHGSDLSVAVVVPRGGRASLHALMTAVCRSAAEACRRSGAAADARLDPATPAPDSSGGAGCRPPSGGLCGAPGLPGGLHALAARERLSYCLTQPSPYAVVIGDRKVAGFAARRYPGSWLIQGSVLVRPLPERLCSALPAEAREALAVRAIDLSSASGRRVDERELARRWASAWEAWWGPAMECMPAACA